jgi:hypothetical protein
LELKTVEESIPYSIFVYAVRSSLTRENYLRRLRKFFDFLGIEQQRTIEERCNIFAQRGKEDTGWAFNSIVKFLHSQKERIEGGEIAGATLHEKMVVKYEDTDTFADTIGQCPYCNCWLYRNGEIGSCNYAYVRRVIDFLPLICCI